ncbi:MAG: NAD(+) diphosphatase [Pseudoruegeria sp.]
MKHAETVTFGGSGLNRAAELRNDPEKIAALQADPTARCMAIWRSKVLVDQNHRNAVVWLDKTHKIWDHAPEKPIFLGLDEAGPRFACDVSGWQPESLDEAALRTFIDPNEYVYPGLPNGQVFSELRMIMSHLTARDAEMAATAKALLEWHKSHQFCARCGEKSEIINAGWQRSCPSCGGQHFPRTDPVVIMLITRGNSVLMGRSPGWPEGMYSLLAGFVEPGETIEAAVRREVLEEANITVGLVTYLASQPWAFPNSLMIGCAGEAMTADITIDPVELEEAMWVSREDIAIAFDGMHPKINPAREGSIARFLLQNWLADTLD